MSGSIVSENNPLVECHFTLEELEYINTIMVREQQMTKYLFKQFQGLDIIGVRVDFVEQPNMVGKLLSYIKKGRGK